MTDTVPILGERPPVTNNDVWDIKLSLARIEERMTASSESAEHRHANLKQAMDNFVPRRELDQTFAGLGARITSIEADVEEKVTESEVTEVKRRIGLIEGNQTWLIRSVLGLVLTSIATAVATVAAFAIKHG